MNSIQLVIFDLDGTLIDAFEDIAMAANFIRSRNGLADLPVSEVKLHVGHGARHLVEGVLGSTESIFIDENLAALVRFYENLTESRARIYDGVVETLKHLRAGLVRTAVASNKPHSVTVRVLDQLGLAEHFDFIRGETAEIRRKPAPDVLLQIMADAGVSPQRTLMVGDTEIDIEAARAAGVRIAVVSYGQHSAERLQKSMPDYMLHSMPELLQVTE
jgi:phosphoglycolate phosphatase